MEEYGQLFMLDIWEKEVLHIGMVVNGKIFMFSDGLVGPNVRGLAIDSDDNVWVATSTGVSKISSPPNSASNVSQSIIEVYPNPTSGKIYVNTPSSKFNTVSVYNNLGSLIYFENLKYQHKIEIDFSSFKKCVYHLSLQFNEGVKNHKILIQ